MAPPRHPRSPPALIDDLIGEIFLRIPPDEPADLIRASIVSKPWYRILSDHTFLRRYREIHRTPPLLGFIRDSERTGVSLFIPTTTASPFNVGQLALGCSSSVALDCRHGRVLVHTSGPEGLVVWDPITDDKHFLPVPPYQYDYYTGTVICAAEDCDHLDCHDGPFTVVFVGTDRSNGGNVTWASVYSSETPVWGAATSINTCYSVEGKHSLLIDDTLYFTLKNGVKILKFDLVEQSLSVMERPKDVYGGIFMTTEDGGLGFVAVLHEDICVWAWQPDAGGIAAWVLHKVIELDTLIKRSPTYRRAAIGFVEGTDTIFINTHTDEGIVMLELKSRKVRKVYENVDYYTVLPYTSFYTPDQC